MSSREERGERFMHLDEAVWALVVYVEGIVRVCGIKEEARGLRWPLAGNEVWCKRLCLCGAAGLGGGGNQATPVS